MYIVTNILVSAFRKDERLFAQEIGEEVQSIKTGVASSAALIVTTDWAIEYPQAMPPNVHVSCTALPILSVRFPLVSSCCSFLS